MATFLLVPVTVPHPHFPAITFAYVERATSATGPWVRIGQAPVVGGSGFYYDNTVPLDTPVWYHFVYPLFSSEVVAPTVVGPLTLVSAGTVILSDPLRPWADIEFGFCDTPEALTAAACTPGGVEFVWSRFGGRNRRVDAGLFDRLNSETPADVYGRRKNLDSSVRILTKTLNAVDQMYDLFTAGGPLYLRAPAAYGRFDYWLQPADLAEDYLSETIDQRFPHRIWTFAYTVVDPVFGLEQGTDCANWCAVKDAFPTFADLTATGDTWADVAAGTTVCP